MDVNVCMEETPSQKSSVLSLLGLISARQRSTQRFVQKQTTIHYGERYTVCCWLHWVTDQEDSCLLEHSVGIIENFQHSLI